MMDEVVQIGQFRITVSPNRELVTVAHSTSRDDPLAPTFGYLDVHVVRDLRYALERALRMMGQQP